MGIAAFGFHRVELGIWKLKNKPLHWRTDMMEKHEATSLQL